MLSHYALVFNFFFRFMSSITPCVAVFLLEEHYVYHSVVFKREILLPLQSRLAPTMQDNEIERPIVLGVFLARIKEIWRVVGE